VANFGTNGLVLQANIGSFAVPNWQALQNGGSFGNNELRWSDVGTIVNNTPSASWPPTNRPATLTQVPYLYSYSADATGSGVESAAPPGLPTTFDRTGHYLQVRMSWDNSGTFGSAPILTAYNTTAGTDPTRSDGTICGGASETIGGGLARSYLKGQMYGANTAAMPAAPGAGPGTDPAGTDGTTGAVTFSGAAAWLAGWQALAGGLDYIQYGATPTAVTAAVLYLMLALFTGPQMNPGVQSFYPTISYTFV
jgi:hypothetical protein